MKRFLAVCLALSIVGAMRAPTSLAQEAAPPQPRPDPGVQLEKQFRDPPSSARPRVWWHWMNGNVTKDGIAKDLAWMKRIGIGGAQNFDASMATPQVVGERLVYMTPEWQSAFRFAATEADRLGLELAIASSPGFTETGGPWVKPEDGMKKLVWSETEVAAGRPLATALPLPPSITGPFQSIPADPTGGLTLVGGERGRIVAPHFSDIAVLAWPTLGAAAIPSLTFTDGAGKSLDAAPLNDDDLSTGIVLSSAGKDAPALIARYAAPYSVRSVRLFIAGSAGRVMGNRFAPVLEASDDGKAWRPVSSIPVATVPTTVSFAPVTARQFRVVLKQAEGGGIPPEYAGIMTRGLDLAAVGGGAGAAMMGGASKAITIEDFRLSSQARVHRAEAKAAYLVAPDYYALGMPAEAQGIPAGSVVDLTGRLRPDGMLDWTPPSLPKGSRWHVLRLGYSLLGTMNHPAPVEATGLEVDKFDGAAVRRYMEHYLGMYRQAAGAEFLGKRGVRALVNDSIEAGAANWTPLLIEQFKARRGYDPTPWLPALTGTIIETRARSDAFLYDYRRTLADLIASEHYGTVAAVAHEQGLAVYGEAQEDLRPNLGDDMAMRRYADVPMGALWTYDRALGPKATYLADMRGAASVANIYGRQFVAAESMTSLLSPWAFGPRDLKRIADLEFATGINRIVIHTSVHVPTDDKKPGLTLSMFGQYFNRNESWAELAKPWVDYLARNSLLLQQGRTVADVGYFYGEEAPLTGLFGEKPVTDAPKRYAYDFVNADALLDVLENDGGDIVSPGGARYKVLYLGGSSRYMTLPVLRKLHALVKNGATVIGTKPLQNSSLAGDPTKFAKLTEMLWPRPGIALIGSGKVIASQDIDESLAALGVAPDFAFSGGSQDSEVLYLHRRSADGDSYFLSNRKDRAETIEVRFRVTGKAPELWHAEDGSAEPLSYRTEGSETVVSLTLAADESVHVVFRKPAKADSLAIRKLVPLERGRVAGPWQVTFEANRGAPAKATFADLAPLNENTDSGIKYFSGIASYSNAFTAPKGWKSGQPLWLDLGEAREIAEVTVNGQAAGYAWHAPYRLDVSRTAKPGRNTLQVRVANLWVNRLIGDRKPGAKPVTWTALPTYTAKAPLRRSGLIGPVTILAQ